MKRKLINRRLWGRSSSWWESSLFATGSLHHNDERAGNIYLDDKKNKNKLQIQNALFNCHSAPRIMMRRLAIFILMLKRMRVEGVLNVRTIGSDSHFEMVFPLCLEKWTKSSPPLRPSTTVRRRVLWPRFANEVPGSQWGKVGPSSTRTSKTTTELSSPPTTRPSRRFLNRWLEYLRNTLFLHHEIFPLRFVKTGRPLRACEASPLPWICVLQISPSSASPRGCAQRSAPSSPQPGEPHTCPSPWWSARTWPSTTSTSRTPSPWPQSPSSLIKCPPTWSAPPQANQTQAACRVSIQIMKIIFSPHSYFPLLSSSALASFCDLWPGAARSRARSRPPNCRPRLTRSRKSLKLWLASRLLQSS